jgi:hypothetical protein
MTALCCLFSSTATKKTACTWRRRSWPTLERERYTSTNLVRSELLNSSAFLQAHGDNLMTMPVPILPDKRLAAINQQNLAKTQEWAAPTGGDDSEVFPCFARKREVTGGGSLPIFTRPDGQQALDTTGK